MKSLRVLLFGGMLGAAGYWLARYLRPEQSPMVLNHAVVVITGASSGIGRALAMSFARRGARLVLAARRAEHLEEVRAAVTPYAADVLVVPTDITDDAALEHLVQETLAKFGQIDILINNAGVYDYGLLQETAVSSIRQMAEVNIASTIALTRLVLPHMLQRRGGRIVNISSVAGRVANAVAPVYGATKAALLAFSDGLRRQIEGTGVQVISVLPTYTTSEMVSSDHADLMRSVGFTIDTVEYVAEGTLDGLLKGKTEIVFGGLIESAAIWCERHFPLLSTAIQRIITTPQFFAAQSALHQKERITDAPKAAATVATAAIKSAGTDETAEAAETPRQETAPAPKPTRGRKAKA